MRVELFAVAGESENKRVITCIVIFTLGVLANLIASRKLLKCKGVFHERTSKVGSIAID